jgi:hypothetical protein
LSAKESENRVINIQRANRKVESLKQANTDDLKIAKESLSNLVLSSAPNILDYFDTNTLSRQVSSSIQSIWSPIKIVMAQLEEQGRALSYAALETFRLIQQSGCEYDRRLLPSRTQVQNVHHHLSVGTYTFTNKVTKCLLLYILC